MSSALDEDMVGSKNSILDDTNADDYQKQQQLRADEEGMVSNEPSRQGSTNRRGRMKHDECPMVRDSWPGISVATPSGSHSLASVSRRSTMSIETSLTLLGRPSSIISGMSLRSASFVGGAWDSSRRESTTSATSRNSSMPGSMVNIDPTDLRRRSYGNVEGNMMQPPYFSNSNSTFAEQASKKPPTPTKSNKRLQVASKAKKSPAKGKIEKADSAKRGQQIRSLIEKRGEQHVYFGRGEPIRNNPGNIRFREIVNTHYDDFFLADKKGKAKIRDDIEKEVKKNKQNGSCVEFFCITVGKQGVLLKSATEEKISDHIGHTLRDTPERRAAYWSWWGAETKQQWTPFDANTGEKLERMYQTARLNLAKRKKDISKPGLVVPVIMDNVRHLVDMTHPMRVSMSRPSQEHGPLVYKVRRKPLAKKDRDGSRDDSGAGSTSRSGTSSPSGCSSGDQPSSPGTLRGSQQQWSPSSSSVAFAVLSADSLTHVQESDKNDKDYDEIVFAAISDEIGQDIGYYSTQHQRGVDTGDDVDVPLEAPPRPKQQRRPIYSQKAAAALVRDIERRQSVVFQRQKVAAAELLDQNQPSSPALMSTLTEGLEALELRGGRPGGKTDDDDDPWEYEKIMDTY